MLSKYKYFTVFIKREIFESDLRKELVPVIRKELEPQIKKSLTEEIRSAASMEKEILSNINKIIKAEKENHIKEDGELNLPEYIAIEQTPKLKRKYTRRADKEKVESQKDEIKIKREKITSSIGPLVNNKGITSHK